MVLLSTSTRGFAKGKDLEQEEEPRYVHLTLHCNKDP